MSDEEQGLRIELVEWLLGRAKYLPDTYQDEADMVGTETERELKIAPHLDRLRALRDGIENNWECLQGLWGLAYPDVDGPRWDETWSPACLNTGVWFYHRDRWVDGRLRLIDFLTKLKEACVSLDEEEVARVLLPEVRPVSHVLWEALKARPRAVVLHFLTLERGAMKQGKKLWEDIQHLVPEKELCDFDNFKRDLSDMRKQKLLGNHKGSTGGYWLREVPDGIPVSLMSGSS